MSFFLDDDDVSDDGGGINVGAGIGGGGVLSQSQESKAEDAFHCLNCGGTTCYEDETSRKLICSECFTQSQNLISASQEELELFESSNGPVGRSTFVASRKSHIQKSCKGLQLEDLDRTEALPGFMDCVLGLQHVLIKTSIIACELACCKKSHKRQILQSVKIMWNRYLKAWRDGAKYFSRLYPETRFNFRDCFLSIRVRQSLFKILVYETTKKLREKINEEEEQKQYDDDYDDSDNDDDNNNDNDNENDNENYNENDYNNDYDDNVKIDQDGTYGYYDNNDNENDNNRSISIHRRAGLDRNRKEGQTDQARLVKTEQTHEFTNNETNDCDNSFAFSSVAVKKDDNSHCSALTHDEDIHAQNPRRFRTERTKRIIIHHHRARNGKSTLVGRRAAALLLNPSMKMVAGVIAIALAPLGITLGHILKWIKNGSLPLGTSFTLLEPTQQEKLKSVRGFFTFHTVPTMPIMLRTVKLLQVACRYKPKKILVRNKRSEIRQESVASTSYKLGTLITVSSLPLVIARFVSELGFGQNVLDFTFALMGLHVSKDMLLPPPLALARPDRVLDPTKILALIAVSFKLLSPTYAGVENGMPNWQKHKFRLPISTNVNMKDENKSQNKHKRKRNPFIPWNGNYFCHISNGSSLDEYVSFLESDVLLFDHITMLNGIPSLEVSSNSCKKQKTAKGSDTNLFQHTSGICDLSKDRKVNPNIIAHSYDQPRVKLWSTTEENVRPYEISNIRRCDLCGPFPPPLGPLLEYMANKTGIDPLGIVKFVSEVDKAIKKKGQPWE